MPLWVRLGCLGLFDADDDYCTVFLVSVVVCLVFLRLAWPRLDRKPREHGQYKTGEVTQHPSSRRLPQRFDSPSGSGSCSGVTHQSINWSISHQKSRGHPFGSQDLLPAATAGPKPHQHSSHTHSDQPSFAAQGPGTTCLVVCARGFAGPPKWPPPSTTHVPIRGVRSQTTLWETSDALATLAALTDL